jgi:polyhydroxyalkanoate depolymerase
MLYETYQAHRDAFGPVRWMAQTLKGLLNQPWPVVAHHPVIRSAAAACEMVERAGMWHERPEFGIRSTTIDGRSVAVDEVAAVRHPFCTLRHFKKDITVEQPRVLLVAPLSGHFATLLRGTVETLLPENDVYITDWVNARNVPLLYGRFDLDDFIDLIASFLRELGPETHVIAVCQPSVPVLAAVALMAADNDPAQPRSMTLMGGPIDTRRNPTVVNQLATSRPLSWFERNVIATVPARYPGQFRRVYPGFLQLAGFMSMNLDRHLKSFQDLYQHRVKGEREKAAAIATFYDEYFAVMDLSAEFYLETVQKIFQQHELPLGKFAFRGRTIEPRAIRRTGLFTVEGERDDICAVGQTLAAHDLCIGIRPYMKRHHVQTGVGHYGVFAGRKWQNQVYPQLRDFIHASE